MIKKQQQNLRKIFSSKINHDLLKFIELYKNYFIPNKLLVDNQSHFEMTPSINFVRSSIFIFKILKNALDNFNRFLFFLVPQLLFLSLKNV